MLGACALVAASAGPVRAARKAVPATIISLDELRARVKKHRGRVLVLHFWATWCLPCLDEVPLISALVREARPKGIDILSVSLDDPTERAAEKVGQVLSERGGEAMTNTIVRVEDPDAFIAGVDARWDGTIPAFFAYDRQGALRRAFVGEMTREQFQRFVADLAGPPVKK